MAPAPANEAASLHSPFYSAPAAAPLCELSCNGYFACPGNARVPAAVQLRRGASFLDAEDACLAISDKTSFLIPEDSVLPEQENCASPCMPAPPRLGSGPCTHSACVMACPLAALPFKPHPLSLSCRPAGPSRLQSASPFLFMDSPALGGLVGEEEFVAASVCFEQAALAVEMVQPHPAASVPRESVGDVPLPDTQPPPQLFCAAGHCAQPSQELAPGVAPTAATFYATVLRRMSSAEPSAGSPAWPCSSGPSGPASDGQCPTAPPKIASCGCMMDVPTDGIPPGAFHGPLGWVGDLGQPPIDSGCVAAAGWLHPSMGVALAGSAHDGASRASMVRTLPEGCWMMGDAGGGGGMVVEEVAEAASCSSSSVPASAAAPAVAAAAMPRAFHHKTGGPCDHCGATESPQWRRGPPAKPMLCNACGTRYRRTNQLSPAAAYATAARAAAQQQQQQQQLTVNKRGTKSGASGAASKRSRAVERW